MKISKKAKTTKQAVSEITVHEGIFQYIFSEIGVENNKKITY